MNLISSLIETWHNYVCFSTTKTKKKNHNFWTIIITINLLHKPMVLVLQHSHTTSQPVTKLLNFYDNTITKATTTNCYLVFISFKKYYKNKRKIIKKKKKRDWLDQCRRFTLLHNGYPPSPPPPTQQTTPPDADR